MGNIHRMVKAGDVVAVGNMLKSSNNAKTLSNELDEKGFTPLYYAIDSGTPRPEMVELLLSSGADPAFVKVNRIPGMANLGIDVNKSLDKLGINLPPGFDLASPTEHRESLLSTALKKGNLTIIKLLHSYGADFSYHTPDNYTAVLDAIYGAEERLELIRYLIGLGLDVNNATRYNETPIVVAYRFGQYQVVAELLKAGANENLLRWTPLIRAVAIGQVSDVRKQLALEQNMDAGDCCGRRALDIALLKGDLDLVKLLVDHGADLTKRGGEKADPMSYAVESDSVTLVKWLVDQGCPVDGRDYLGKTALASAAESGNLDMVKALLEYGADPNADQMYGALLEDARDRETILILLQHGADPGTLDNEGRRKLVGLGEPDPDALDAISRDQYLADRYPVQGSANPDNQTSPFRVAMIKAGLNAYGARHHFKDPASFKGGRPPAVWCADRVGQSTTLLPDGRVILIGGEHEDSYDPDFCIYNDVFVFGPDGGVEIFGYPYSVFPPTDFHTATLNDQWIYIIGGLGYPNRRTFRIEAYRLNALDSNVEPLSTTGTAPGQLYKHRAILLDAGAIKIEGGTLARKNGGKEEHVPNRDAYLLDLESLVWTRQPR